MGSSQELNRQLTTLLTDRFWDNPLRIVEIAELGDAGVNAQGFLISFYLRFHFRSTRLTPVCPAEGEVILNVLKEELPEERENRFWAFALGVAMYASILMVL